MGQLLESTVEPENISLLSRGELLQTTNLSVPGALRQTRTGNRLFTEYGGKAQTSLSEEKAEL